MSFGVLPTTNNKPFFAPRTLRSGGAGARVASWKPPRCGYAGAAAAVGTGLMGTSFYDLLGISQGGSLAEIKKAYKQMARKYHPDVSPPGLADEHTRRFIEVQEAYETLSDPERRKVYDRDLGRGLHCALSSRRRLDQELEEKWMWKIRWNDQLDGLKKRNMNRDSSANLSWAARMRRQRAEASAEDHLGGIAISDYYYACKS